MGTKLERFERFLATTGTHALVTLDDCKQLFSDAECLLGQAIAERFNQTQGNGATTLGFREWRALMQKGGA